MHKKMKGFELPAGSGFLLATLFIAGTYFIVSGCSRYYYPARSQQPRQPQQPQVQQPTHRPVQKPHTRPVVKHAPQRQPARPARPRQPARPHLPARPRQPQAPVVRGHGSYMAYPAMQQLINRMTRKGFSRNYLLQIFSGVERDNNILAKVKSPAEAKPWRSYRPIFLTEQRIQGGVGFWRRYEGALNAATQRFGVDPEYIVAIIGVETLYGRNTGKYNVLRSLTTLAMDFPKRSKFYTSELEQFLQLTREEKINNPAALKGSYAGAMGMGQFISSSYRNFAVDFNGDRHRDLWHPVDAIGSVANYFSRHGWKRGGDVAVPARITGTSYARIAHTEAKKPIYSLRQLAQYGVTPAQPIRSTRVDLLRLIGTRSDEYWVTGDNFYTITRYNHSPKYAMAVYQLAQEIKRRKTGR